MPDDRINPPAGLKRMVDDIVKDGSEQGTVVVVCEGLYDACRLTDALEHYYVKSSKKNDPARRISFPRTKPENFEGERRHRFEDGCYHRGRIASEPVHIYIADAPFHVFPSARKAVTFIDPKGKPL